MNHARLSALLLALPLMAQAEIVETAPDDIRVAEPSAVSSSDALLSEDKPSENPAVLELSDEELIRQPELARQMLNQLIDARQWDLLPDLLALYRQTANPDPTLIAYAESHLLIAEGDYKAAIRKLRKILAVNDDFAPVRFLLARALFADRQDQAAKNQFERIRADNPPEDIAVLSGRYLEAVAQRGSWDYGFNVSYLQEDNVNNASDSEVVRVNGVPFQKSEELLPQKAHGLQYGFNAGKKWNVGGGHYVALDNGFNAKQYWDNHRFDDLNNRLSLGYQYQDSQNRFALLPFYERRWVGGRRYSKGHGVRTEFERWLGPKWQLSLAGEWGGTRQSDEESRDADNRSRLYSATLVHLPNAKSFVYAGLDASGENAKEDIYSFSRVGGRVGWSQSWPAGIATRLNVNYAYKKYDVPNRIFQTVRKDKELGATLTVWKQDWHVWGITPKLSFNVLKVSSNLPDLYSYQKKRAFLSFEKTF